ncbi:SWIM zinc finger protein [Krasilnikovia cinnamomea]|uniref:SWIM zinc finger protein n=1 Tax=Krasilnikovia cinnamomea TaxID=349313 RepID=A0A4Q7ZGA1_9ACTN|nr:SWIM zinc finger family protein [Krasilnikovia cinnamomea]RZU49155.1 SWIM zinc finger protein [Krasilnikovia cinnamomea]
MPVERWTTAEPDGTADLGGAAQPPDVPRWNDARVAALAPDAGSLRAARAVSGAGHWAATGLLGEILWGLCRGSGSSPYQVCVDLAGPAYRCSCPSRKIPCKHALGLLLRWVDGPDLPTEPAPAFAAEWQAARAARAARAATPPGGAPADPAGAHQRARQRAERVAAGMTELRRWLDDQVQQGLAAAEQAGHRPYETMAARLVDAQAPAAATAVRRLGGLVGVGPLWADRLLGELGLLRLLVAGHERLDELPPGLAATVRARIGFPVATDDVLSGPRVTDRWQVLGQVETDDGALTTRRTWLRGADSGRFALVLAFAAAGQSLNPDFAPGTELRADLCFYPGTTPLRALVAERHSAAVAYAAPAGALPARAALAGWAAALASDPWRHDAPVLLAGVTPTGTGWVVDTTGEALPLAPGHHEPWWLLAAAGGAPATLAAEWSPAGLRPLAAWVGGRHIPAPAPLFDSRGPDLPPELPSDLLAAALLGTARRPWTQPGARLAGRTLAGPTPPASASSGSAPSAPASLLDAAATALAYGRAGTTPATGHRPVAAAPPEQAAPLPTAAADRLLRLVDGDAPGGAQAVQELLAQWLAAAARRGGHVPPQALPALLEAGRRNATLRPALGMVAGRRGGWLAAQRADWRWLLDEAPGAAAAEPEVWRTGSPGERLAYLARMRADDPDAARDQLVAGWDTEAPEERARFVAALSAGLSAADEAFLERVLDDPRREVREAALELLRRLPASGLSRRMARRAHAAVRLERTRGGERLVVDPPQTLDPALRRDGVGATPARGMGIGAWLLEEVVAGTPLDTWTTALHRDPAAVVELGRGHDWATPLLHGWAKAAIAQRDPAWAAALLAADSRRGAAGLREAVRWDLHLILPPAELGRLAADALRREDHVAHRLLAVHPGRWPDELAVAVIETIAHRARTDRHSWQLGELCRAAAMAMPTGYAGAVARLAAELDAEPADPSRVRPVAELARTLTFRHEMLQELQ